jgi:hypothetical protein
MVRTCERTLHVRQFRDDADGDHARVTALGSARPGDEEREDAG